MEMNNYVVLSVSTTSMKDLSRRMVSLFMVLMLFVSTGGFTFNLHYCQGDLQSARVITEAPSCHQIAKNGTDNHHCQKEKKNSDSNEKKSCAESCQKGCCDQRSITVESEYDLIVFENIPLKEKESMQAVLAVWPAYIETVSAHQNIIRGFQKHKPPPLIKDTHVLYQSFLL